MKSDDLKPKMKVRIVWTDEHDEDYVENTVGMAEKMRDWDYGFVFDARTQICPSGEDDMVALINSITNSVDCERYWWPVSMLEPFYNASDFHKLLEE